MLPRKARRQAALPPKLEAVLVCLGRSGRLNVTQAVKLPYLVDVVARHVLGRPITEGTHQTWKHGVVTAEAWHYLDRVGETAGALRVEPVRWSEEKRVIVAADATEEGLTPEERAIVDFVTAHFAGRSASDLGPMTKRMNPTIHSWGSGNRLADVGEDAYERMSTAYQAMAERASHLTLDRLHREATPIESVEDVVA